MKAPAVFQEWQHPRNPDGTFREAGPPQPGRPPLGSQRAFAAQQAPGASAPRGGAPRSLTRGSPRAPSATLLRWQPRLRAFLDADPRNPETLIERVVELVHGMVESDTGGEPPSWNSDWEQEALEQVRDERGASQDDWEQVYDPAGPYAETIWDRAYEEALDRALNTDIAADSDEYAEDGILAAAQNAYSAYRGVTLDDPAGLDGGARDDISEFTHRFSRLIADWLAGLEYDSGSDDGAALARLHAALDVRPGNAYDAFGATSDPARRGWRDVWLRQGLEDIERYQAVRRRFYDGCSAEPSLSAWELFEDSGVHSDADTDRMIAFVNDQAAPMPASIDREHPRLRRLRQELEEGKKISGLRNGERPLDAVIVPARGEPGRVQVWIRYGGKRSRRGSGPNRAVQILETGGSG